METTQLRIGDTDVILNDFDLGKGKIIISNDEYGYNFSYYWGAMGQGSTLREFISRISSDYFVGKLSPYTKGDMNIKKTIRAIRKEWVEHGYPWYEYMGKQKELRQSLREIEMFCSDDRHFVGMMSRLDEDFRPFHSKKCDFYQSLSCITTEPWNFIIYDENRANSWLSKFHEKLIQNINP